jgi:hypothetical protein
MLDHGPDPALAADHANVRGRRFKNLFQAGLVVHVSARHQHDVGIRVNR